MQQHREGGFGGYQIPQSSARVLRNSLRNSSLHLETSFSGAALGRFPQIAWEVFEKSGRHQCGLPTKNRFYPPQHHNVPLWYIKPQRGKFGFLCSRVQKYLSLAPAQCIIQDRSLRTNLHSQIYQKFASLGTSRLNVHQLTTVATHHGLASSLSTPVISGLVGGDGVFLAVWWEGTKPRLQCRPWRFRHATSAWATAGLCRVVSATGGGETRATHCSASSPLCWDQG